MLLSLNLFASFVFIVCIIKFLLENFFDRSYVFDLYISFRNARIDIVDDTFDFAFVQLSFFVLIVETYYHFRIFVDDDF